MSEATNPEFELLVGISEDIHRIANHLAPKEVSDNSVFAQISGAIIGAADALQEILDSGENIAVQRRLMRELVDRWRAISNEYVRKQVKLDQERAFGKPDVTKQATD